MELTIEEALRKAVAAQRDGQTQEADRLYTAILKVFPKHPHANHNLGVLAVSIGRVEEAVPFFHTALESNPEIDQFWYSYIFALVKLNRFVDARSALEWARHSGAKEEVLEGLAERLTENVSGKFKNNVKAIKDTKSIRASTASTCQDPPKDLLRSLIKVYRAGQTQKALKKSKTLLEAFPRSAALHNIQGVVYHAMGLTDRSFKAYNKAISIKPEFAEAHNNLGNYYKAQGKLQKAIESYNEAISINHDFADAYNNLGNALVQRKNLEEAIRAYTSAIAITPDHVQAHYNLGNALKDLGKLEEAINAYKKALSLNPEFAEAYNNMGNSLQAHGKFDQAVEAYNKAIAINPNYAEAYNNLGNSLHELGKLEDALHAYNSALSINSDYAEAYNNLGKILQDDGKLEDAILAYQKALVIKPSDVTTLENVSGLLIQLSDKSEINDELIRSYEKHHVDVMNTPKFHVQQAVRSYLKEDENSAMRHLHSYNLCYPNAIASLGKQDLIFCTAYNTFLNKLIKLRKGDAPNLNYDQIVFHLGESHCLSYAHEIVKLNGVRHRIVPKITFGGKAFHFGRDKTDKFKAITKNNFDSLPNQSVVFVSFGEIDCRADEGLITASEKFNEPIEELIAKTVEGYFNWFCAQNKKKNHSLYFFNIPAPVYNYNSTSELNVALANTVLEFNQAMLKYSSSYHFNLIDTYTFTANEQGFSNMKYHIDGVHLGPSALQAFEIQLN